MKEEAQNPEKPAEQSFSLFQLNQHLRRVVTLNMRQPLWIRCEVASANISRGNLYLGLVERDDWQLKARAGGIIWKHDLARLQKRMGELLDSVLRVGQQVLIKVQVDFNEFHGLKLSVRDIDPNFTVGQVEMQRLESLNKLQEEKFLELNNQLPLPLVTQRIAIISSPRAAGLQDFRKQLDENPYGIQFHSELFEAAVQGASVEREVVQQIAVIEARHKEFDCIAIVRGGGARLDLMGFDSFELCKAIATCELPVITGIGHDIDETLADLVAHTALKTPTAVADFLVTRAVDFEATINELAQRLQTAAQERIQQEKSYLVQQQQRLQLLALGQIQSQEQFLENLEEKFRLLHPQNTLKRGYTLLYDENGEPITQFDQLQAGQLLRVRHKEGELLVEIKTVNKEGAKK